MNFAEFLRRWPYTIDTIAILIFAAFMAAIIWTAVVGLKRMAQYNETQKRHLAFQRTCGLCVWSAWFLLDTLLRKHPTGVLITLGLLILSQLAIFVAGRLIYGEEGSLKKPKKDKPTHTS